MPQAEAASAAASQAAPAVTGSTAMPSPMPPATHERTTI
jgi:hypothetical protein